MCKTHCPLLITFGRSLESSLMEASVQIVWFACTAHFHLVHHKDTGGAWFSRVLISLRGNLPTHTAGVETISRMCIFRATRQIALDRLRGNDIIRELVYYRVLRLAFVVAD